MVRILITGTKKQISKKYDKIFSIIDKHSTFFKYCTEDEYSTDEGYILEFKTIPPEAMIELENIKGIEIL